MSELSPRVTLSALIKRYLIKRLAWAIIALNLIMGWFMHARYHQLSDSILLALVGTEVGLFEEHEARCEESSCSHLHTQSIRFPWDGGEQVEKLSFVYDSACELLQSSKPQGRLRALEDSLVTRPQPQGALCQASPSAMFARLERPGEEHLELRVAVAPAVNRAGERLTFVVGIPHTPIDFVLAWVSGVSVLISLLVFGVSWWSARHVSRYLTAELEHLEASCEALTLGDALKAGRLSDLQDLEERRGLITEPTQETPRELVTLAHTFNALYQQLTALLSAQRTFIAEAAHELRTPITALRGELELAMRRERSPEEYRETLHYLTEDVRRLQGLSERLLESASSQERALSLAPLSLQACIDEALSSIPLSQQHQQHSAVVTEPPELTLELSEVLWLCGERDASVRAIHNLITNSLKHAHARHLTLSATQRGEWVELSISDDGVGLPDALRGSLFEPFARGSVSAGAGLGLSIVRALMHRQGGEALVDERSFGGEGARFTLRWRAALSAAPHLKSSPAP